MISLQVALVRTQLKRKPHPFPSNCVNDWAGQYKRGMPEPNPKYNEMLCQSFCVEDTLLPICNCTMAGVQEITRDKNLLCETTETCMGELTKATKDFAIDVSMNVSSRYYT